MGMDLSSFYLSVEWDLMAVPARRKVIFYRFVLQSFIEWILFKIFFFVLFCLAVAIHHILILHSI